MSTKERILKAINKLLPIDEYNECDYIFSDKYSLTSTVMVYVLLELSKDFNFKITDDFIDALEMCTFAQLETLLEEYSNKAA